MLSETNAQQICADLHMHSVYSDGCQEPETMLDMAREQGLTCIALTDHDALAGSKELLRKVSAEHSDVRVIPGVEISTQTGWRDVHMLGYFIDLEHPALNQLFEQNRANREERACKMADNMAEDGYPVSGQLMRESGKTVNRTLLARMLVEKGFASDIDEAYRTLIGRRSKYYVENVNFDTVEAMKLILEAGGCPFIAHPAQYREVDLVVPFKREGMVGLEAFHTMHTQKQREDLCTLARDEGLAISGGSDWHGDTTHGATLGGAGLDEAQLTAFLRACGRL